MFIMKVLSFSCVAAVLVFDVVANYAFKNMHWIDLYDTHECHITCVGGY